MHFGLHREKHLILLSIFFVEWCTLQAPFYRNSILYRVEPTGKDDPGRARYFWVFCLQDVWAHAQV